MNKAIGILAVVSILLGGEYLGFSVDAVVRQSEQKDVQKALKEIHDEVVALGKYPGDDFFKREVFVGEDDDDTNKDIHVAIVIHDTGDEENMTIQVTYMMRNKGSPVVGIAKSEKSIKCSHQKNQFHIKHSGFSEREIKSVLKDILRAVRNKKKLLEKINF